MARLGRGKPLYPTGGTTFQPGYHPSPSAGPYPGYVSPPSYTYDPAIEAERRAAQRGLEDTEDRVKTTRHFEQSKLKQALIKVHRTAARGRQDIGIAQQRGEQQLGYEREDATRSAARRQEDFQAQLATIARQFKELGHRQGEAAGASGVADSGTAAASAAARARNEGQAEAPIHVGQQRVAEDLSTALDRLGTAEGELGEDTARKLGRTNQDARFDKRGAKREFGQKAFELFRELQQARREGRITDIDKLQQEIYEARANHPGAFAKWSKEHPGAVAAATAGTRPPASGGTGAGGGGGGNKGGGNHKKGKK